MSLEGPSLAPRSGGNAAAVVVLLHGVGADGHDLEGLAPALAKVLPDAAFYAPHAPYPCDMAPFGRQWFSLQDRRPQTLLAGVQAVAPTLQQYLDMLLTHHGLAHDRLALLGFSQGAMLALHLAPRLPRPLAAVLAYSGALIDTTGLDQPEIQRPPILLVHGDQDEIVPVQNHHAAVAALKGAGFNVQAMVRPGLGHGIDPEGLEAGSRFLKEALAPPPQAGG